MIEFKCIKKIISIRRVYLLLHNDRRFRLSKTNFTGKQARKKHTHGGMTTDQAEKWKSKQISEMNKRVYKSNSIRANSLLLLAAQRWRMSMSLNTFQARKKNIFLNYLMRNNMTTHHPAIFSTLFINGSYITRAMGFVFLFFQERNRSESWHKSTVKYLDLLRFLEIKYARKWITTRQFTKINFA